MNVAVSHLRLADRDTPTLGDERTRCPDRERVPYLDSTGDLNGRRGSRMAGHGCVSPTFVIGGDKRRDRDPHRPLRESNSNRRETWRPNT
jgi:hypothetical protein